MPSLSSSSDDVEGPVRIRLEAGIWECFWKVKDVAWFPVGCRAVEYRVYVRLNFPLFLYPCLLKYHLLEKHWIEWSLVLLPGSEIYFLSQNCPFEIANLNLDLIKLMTTLYKSAAVARTTKGICFLLVRHSTCKGHTLLILFVWSYMGNVNLCNSQRLNRKIIVMKFDNFCFDFYSLTVGICFSWMLICIQISSHMATVLVITKRSKENTWYALVFNMYHYSCFIFIFYDYFIECLFQTSDFENENYLKSLWTDIPKWMIELQKSEGQMLSSETDTNSETNLEVIKINLHTLIGIRLLHERKEG